MKKGFKAKVVGYILIGLSLLSACIFLSNINLLIPKSYDLALDGIVVSRNIMLIFLLFGLTRLGYHLAEK